MANKTVYPFGTGGSLPSSIGIINDVTTGGSDKALSAEMGKVLQEEIEASASNYSVVPVNGVFPPPLNYADGLVFFLDGRDFVAGQSWVDKIGGVAFTMTDCTKDGDGVRFNGTSAHGAGSSTLDFPCQSYTIEMVVKLEKSVEATADSVVVFNSALSGGFALGWGFNNHNKKVFTNQCATSYENIAYEAPGVGTHRYSVNKDVSVLNGEKLQFVFGNRLMNWGAASGATIGSNYSGTNFFFKGVIYAIRVYNRLLTEAEMIYNQVLDLTNYDL